MQQRDSWGLTKACGRQTCAGCRVSNIQNNFSLNNRRFEDELAQVCRQEVSLIPYYRSRAACLPGSTRMERSRGRALHQVSQRRQASAGRESIRELTHWRQPRHSPRSPQRQASDTLATAWSKQHDFVASTIIGVTTAAQLDPILAAADVTLSADVLKQIDAVSRDILSPGRASLDPRPERI